MASRFSKIAFPLHNVSYNVYVHLSHMISETLVASNGKKCFMAYSPKQALVTCSDVINLIDKLIQLIAVEIKQ